jgi:DNA-binding XRE family transcriptional regulator
MRMRHDPAETMEARFDGSSPPHGYIAGLDASSLQDERLGKIFRDMRQTMQVSRETVARRLATTASTIESFETGALRALPNWKETNRIVRTYCDLLRVDHEPILQHISGQLQVLASLPRPTKVPTPVEFTTSRTGPRSQPAERTARSERTQARPQPGRRRRRARALFALSAPLALVAGLVYLAQAAPLPVYRAASMLPASAEIAVRVGLDYLVLLSAPRRDGLRWIDVSDPRARKADKLQPGSR